MEISFFHVGLVFKKIPQLETFQKGSLNKKLGEEGGGRGGVAKYN